jgi:ATP-dependent DNA ligase
LLERKHRLRAVMPKIESRLLHVDHVRERGVELFEAARERDLEGIIGKGTRGRYHSDGLKTSLVKIENSSYSKVACRRELFEARDERKLRRQDYRTPILEVRL